MYRELDECYNGLYKYILMMLVQAYIAVGAAGLFAYIINSQWFIEIFLFFIASPMISVFIGLPLVWYLDIKPVTDKKESES